jgi:L-aspartate oxidase
MRERFPTIAATCARYGLDLARDLIPVAPAAHYFMGGVAVDTSARTTVPHLYAVGEVACTGVHGANRLASNSLLEGLVFGRRAARAIAANAGALDFWPLTPSLPGQVVDAAGLVAPEVDVSAPIAHQTRARIRALMWERVSLRRDEDGLASALTELRDIATGAACDPETASMLFAARAITLSALARTESRGAHYRLDYLERDARRDGQHSLLAPAHAAGNPMRRTEVGAHA